jgi:hypothetical protein
MSIFTHYGSSSCYETLASVRTESIIHQPLGEFALGSGTVT